jgi:hypothetical protein
LTIDSEESFSAAHAAAPSCGETHHPTFSDMHEEAARYPDYWAELAMLSFSEDMLGAIQAQSVARACSLSRRVYH